ncbi:MAG TPA: response regulator [Vicinamibacterales bacterium]|nr:response regulator [Vicinamibacterales bacterium]
MPAVLVVDDEALIRWSLSEALSESGYVVCLAATAAEARAVMETFDNRPLIVVLDLRLPDVSDLSFLREMRQRRPDVPVIMMTAHGTPDDAAKAHGLGAARFVGKPFDVAEMVRFVDDAWKRSA